MEFKTSPIDNEGIESWLKGAKEIERWYEPLVGKDSITTHGTQEWKDKANSRKSELDDTICYGMWLVNEYPGWEEPGVVEKCDALLLKDLNETYKNLQYASEYIDYWNTHKQ